MSASSSSIHFRIAVSTDIPQLTGLLGLLFAQESDFQPDASRQSRGLALIIGQPQIGNVYCAVVGDRVVGMVSILFSVSTAEGGRAAWLEDLIIHPDWRSQGIGRQLLDHAIDGARASGCLRITLLTDVTNAAARRFYARAGFAPSQMSPLRLKL